MQKFFKRFANLRRKKCLAFVLSGGGSRGAFQVGALQALLEAGLQPDLLVGTSIGAANAAYLAIHGFSAESLLGLREVWREAESADLLPANYLWLTVRNLFDRQAIDPAHRMRNFLIAHGLKPELRFADLHPIRLVVVSADLNSGFPISHGADPEEMLLEAVLASTALPPWIAPIKQESRFLMDGGVLSNLPIEPALNAGATEIIAINLVRRNEIVASAEGFGHFMEKMIAAVQIRQVELELSLAAARKVPTLHIRLEWPLPIPIWDFQYTQGLFEIGYALTRQKLQESAYKP